MHEIIKVARTSTKLFDIFCKKKRNRYKNVTEEDKQKVNEYVKSYRNTIKMAFRKKFLLCIV